MGEAVTLGDPLARETFVEDEGPLPLQLMEGDPLTLPPKGEQQGEKRAAPPPSPSTGGADKGENAKKRQVNWESPSWPVVVNRIGARGAHTGASPTCLDWLKQKWREELGTEGFLSDDDARSEAAMLFSSVVVPYFCAG